MRKPNKKLLRELIRSRKGARKGAAAAAGCNEHTISNWMKPGYDGGVMEYHAIPVAHYFQVDFDVLFPRVPAAGKKRAA